MLKLIKLEIRKFKLLTTLRSIFLIDLVILGVICLTNFAIDNEDTVTYGNLSEQLGAIGVLVMVSFIVFSAVLIARIIISEYKNKTISVMFMYPISRKKIMASKLLFIAGFTFTAIIASQALVSGAYIVINHFFEFVKEDLTKDIINNTVRMFLLTAVSSAGIGLIPLFFGMLKKSTVTTIVSSIIIISLIGNISGGAGVTALIPPALAVIGVIIAYLSFRNIEHVDVNC